MSFHLFHVGMMVESHPALVSVLLVPQWSTRWWTQTEPWMLWPAWVSPAPAPPASLRAAPALPPQPDRLCRRSFRVPGAWRPGCSRLLPAERTRFGTWARPWAWRGSEDCPSAAWGRAARRPSHRSDGRWAALTSARKRLKGFFFDWRCLSSKCPRQWNFSRTSSAWQTMKFSCRLLGQTWWFLLPGGTERLHDGSRWTNPSSCSLHPPRWPLPRVGTPSRLRTCLKSSASPSSNRPTVKHSDRSNAFVI